MTDAVHTELRVRYQETDKMGVVYHANYLVWFEVGRVELLRSLGASYRGLEEDDVHFPVVEVGCRYHRPALFDDHLIVTTRAERLRRAQLRFRYEVTRSDDATLLAEGWTTHVATDREGAPRRLPARLLDRLETATVGESA